MLRYLMILLLVPLGLALTAGCNKRIVNTVEPAMTTAEPNVIQDERIVTDQSLSRRARVLQVIESETPQGLKRVQVEVWNSRKSRHRFKYKFEWVDFDGNLLRSPMSGWQQRSLAGKERGFLSSTAPSPTAADFRLQMIEDKDAL